MKLDFVNVQTLVEETDGKHTFRNGDNFIEVQNGKTFTLDFNDETQVHFHFDNKRNDVLVRLMQNHKEITRKTMSTDAVPHYLALFGTEGMTKDQIVNHLSSQKTWYHKMFNAIKGVPAFQKILVD